MDFQKFLMNPLILVGAAMLLLGPKKWQLISIGLIGAGLFTSNGNILGALAGSVSPTPSPTGDLPQAPVESGGIGDIFETGGVA